MRSGGGCRLGRQPLSLQVGGRGAGGDRSHRKDSPGRISKSPCWLLTPRPCWGSSAVSQLRHELWPAQPLRLCPGASLIRPVTLRGVGDGSLSVEKLRQTPLLALVPRAGTSPCCPPLSGSLCLPRFRPREGAVGRGDRRLLLLCSLLLSPALAAGARTWLQ